MDYTLHCKIQQQCFCGLDSGALFFPCVYYHTYQSSKARFSCDTPVENYIFYFFVPDNVFITHTILKYKFEYMFQCVNSSFHFLKPSLFWTLISCSEYLCLCQVLFFTLSGTLSRSICPKLSQVGFDPKYLVKYLCFIIYFHSLNFSWLMLFMRIISSLKSHNFPSCITF